MHCQARVWVVIGFCERLRENDELRFQISNLRSLDCAVLGLDYSESGTASGKQKPEYESGLDYKERGHSVMADKIAHHLNRLARAEAEAVQPGR